jgi:threonine dehydrogenase-like Zn-dependent dehydrogenase
LTHVIAVDTRAEALRLAEKCGADLIVPSGDKAAEQIRQTTGGRGADVVPDFVGANATLALSAGARCLVQPRVTTFPLDEAMTAYAPSGSPTVSQSAASRPTDPASINATRQPL